MPAQGRPFPSSRYPPSGERGRGLPSQGRPRLGVRDCYGVRSMFVNAGAAGLVILYADMVFSGPPPWAL